MTVFRVVGSEDRESEEFRRSFMSSYELGKPPRPNSPEQRYTLIHRAISVFERRYQAAAMASAYPIGDFVATLRLPAGQGGFCTAKWGSEGHMSLWGEALMLAGTTADIVRVVD